jgi:hypothetical protein
VAAFTAAPHLPQNFAPSLSRLLQVGHFAAAAGGSSILPPHFPQNLLSPELPH